MTAFAAWPEVALGDVCEFKYGKGLPAGQRQPGKFSVYGSNGPVGEHNQTLTSGPTIVIGRKGSLGEVNYSGSACWPIDTTYFVDATATKADLPWLAHLLPTLRLTDLNRAAAVPGLNREDAYRQRLLLPPLEEQRRIAAILDQADALRAKRRDALGHLDDLTQSIFLDMFGAPSSNPKGWPTARLGDVSRVIRGASPRPAGDPRYFGGPIPWLKIADVTAANGRFVETIKESVTDAGRDKSVYLDAGTLILTNSATVGIPKVLGLPSCIHDGFLAFLDLDQCLEQTYLYATLLIMRPALMRMAPEGTQKNLNTPIVKALELPLPPRRLQRAFVDRLVRAEQLSDSQLAHSFELDALFESLQSRAFSGRL